MPAEQTSTSRPPSSLSTRATAASSSAELVTSPAIADRPAAELVRRRLHARGVEIEDRDATPACLDAPRAGRADAARPAGDEGDAPFEVGVCHWQRV